MIPTCPLCTAVVEDTLWQDEFCRVVWVDDADYPGFCRVILASHVREMTDLGEAERQRLMAVVFAVEAAVRATLSPDKINLASFGNVVPHVHWHIVPRFRDDRHFPDPIWATARRSAGDRRADPELRARLAQALASHLPPSRE